MRDHNLLSLWFHELTRTGEALKCVHYMFKLKMSQLDYCYLNVYNLKQLWQDCLSGKVNPNELNKTLVGFFVFQMKFINVITQ